MTTAEQSTLLLMRVLADLADVDDRDLSSMCHAASQQRTWSPSALTIAEAQRVNVMLQALAAANYDRVRPPNRAAKWSQIESEWSA